MLRLSVFKIAITILCVVSSADAIDEFDAAGVIESASGITKNQADMADISQKPGGGIILSGDCSDYIDLSALPLPISIGGQTSGADNNYGPYSERPECWLGPWYSSSCAGPDITYKWSAPADTIYILTAANSSFDTGLELYDFTCPTEPIFPDNFICGNDDWGGTAQSRVAVHLSEGQEILVVVDGYAGGSGVFQLFIDVAPGPLELFDCPENAVYGQPPTSTYGVWSLWTSDFYAGSGITVYDNVLADDLYTCGIEFYGFDNYFSNGAWHECTDDSPEFLVSFYEAGGGGYPGSLVWEQVIAPERFQLGVSYSGFVLNRYRAEFDTCITINGGWISILGISQGGHPTDCTFLWLNSPGGDQSCWQNANGQWYNWGTSLNFCLLDSTSTAIYANTPEFPNTISSAANYPNPFNAQTEIHYYLSKDAIVSIDIFDMLGRRISTIEQGLKPAGDHQAVWDASGRSSGVYFYSIKADGEVQENKMLLIK